MKDRFRAEVTTIIILNFIITFVYKSLSQVNIASLTIKTIDLFHWASVILCHNNIFVIAHYERFSNKINIRLAFRMIWLRPYSLHVVKNYFMRQILSRWQYYEKAFVLCVKQYFVENDYEARLSNTTEKEKSWRASPVTHLELINPLKWRRVVTAG